LDGSGSLSFDVLSWLNEQKVSLIRIGWRGAAAYFRAWQGMPIKRRGTSRRPIPDNWHSIEQRSSPFHLAGNRNAAHPVNAILNYAYTVLESELRIKAIAEGYDPNIGVMHEGRDGSPKFVFDLMEPQRPKVDHAVLDFVKSTVFDPVDFTIRSDGVCRLNPQARYVAKISAVFAEQGRHLTVALAVPPSSF
jgi:CRISPR-associated protein Cas1